MKLANVLSNDSRHYSDAGASLILKVILDLKAEGEGCTLGSRCMTYLSNKSYKKLAEIPTIVAVVTSVLINNPDTDQ